VPPHHTVVNPTNEYPLQWSFGVVGQGVRFPSRVQGSGCRAQGARFRVQGDGCWSRVPGPGFRIPSSGFRAHIRHSRLRSGLGCQVKVFKTFQGVPSSPGGSVALLLLLYYSLA